MSEHFDLQCITVEHAHTPDEDLLDSRYDHAVGTLKTFIEAPGVELFVQKGSARLTATGSTASVLLVAGDFVTFDGVGELTAEFLAPTSFCCEDELLWDRA
jgi:hypothetical protein